MATAALQEVIDQFREAFAQFFNGEITAQQLSDITGLGPEELAYCLPDYVDTVNTTAKQYGGDNVVNVPHPPPAPPHGSDPTVYNTYLSQVQNTYVNDESITQVINNFGTGDVNAQIATEGGVNIGPGSTLDDTGIITGDPSAPVAIGTDGDVNQVDDITNTVGPGGQGQVGVNQGDGKLQQAQQDNDIDITKIGDNTGGAGGTSGAATSGAATGGAGTGTGGDADADGGAGGDAGAAAAAGGGGGLLGLGGGGAAAAGAAGGAGGDGGAADASGTGTGGAADSGNATSGSAAGGDAGDDIDADGGDIVFN